ncbi:MAG: deoxyribodipyrimidine photo-lyase [bacterium]
MIEESRVKALNDRAERAGRYVLYWMQASQRAEYNHALEYAVQEANRQGVPVVVFFALTDGFPEANLRHYRFMLDGLAITRAALEARGMRLVIQRGAPDGAAVRMAREARLVVTDRGYLRIQKQWRAAAAARIACPLVQVETDVVVPVEHASPVEEYAAATLRPKIRRLLGQYLRPLRHSRPKRDSLGLALGSDEAGGLDAALRRLRIDNSVGPAPAIRGGAPEARKRLRAFIKDDLRHFADLRNDPGCDRLSGMSPYLHFGQISPIYVALEVMKAGSGKAGAAGTNAYLEELVVRRELSMNFVLYNDRYDSFGCLPAWARRTLAAHARDRRGYRYRLTDLEAARTHDPYWNAAQIEARLTGKMHGYMRMYWGKKILEWSATPERAFKAALYLNNRYELDGRDANGFAGVAWCFGKHDRPWGERPIFGSVRYMTDGGLRRKFDIEGYVRRVGALAGAGPSRSGEESAA